MEWLALGCSGEQHPGLVPRRSLLEQLDEAAPATSTCCASTSLLGLVSLLQRVGSAPWSQGNTADREQL